MLPKKAGGRPKVYATKEEARQRDLEKRRQRRQRRQQASGPADFVAYEPIPTDIPFETLPELGIRSGLALRITPERGEHHPEEEAEIARRVQQIQADERDNSTEEEEYDAEVAARLGQMTAADYEVAGILEKIQSGYAEGEMRTDVELEPSDSAIQQFDEELDTGVQQEENSPVAANNISPVQRSEQDAPSGNGSARSQSSRSKSRRSTSFPAQKNTLSSWIKPPREATTASPTPPVSQSAISPPSPIIPDARARETPMPAAPTAPRSTPAPNSADTSPVERTASKLAKHLRNFQGCTHEEHAALDRKHRAHHRREDVHSECSSIAEITSLIRGSFAGGTPLPDVLSSGKLMRATDVDGLDCQAAFEGTSPRATPAETEARDRGLPRNLCLSAYHTTSRKRRRPEVSFDIDSTCCFPTSLGFARRGINWFPKVHSILNLTADIHFGLKVRSYTDQGRPSARYAPLHKVPHYCFGTIIGMSELHLLIFFPALHEESDYEHSNYLSKHDQQLWLDAIVLPAITKVVGSSNILSGYPASSRIADLDATAGSAENLGRKESARELLLQHAIQPQHLDPLWTLIQDAIEENPGFHRFRGATLFAHTKNTKLESLRSSLTTAFDVWQQRWSEATDPEFYNKDRTYVDLGKQISSEDSALPYDQVGEDREAEVFLWKKCCLDAYARTRVVLNPDGSKARGSPKRTTYTWAAMRDTTGQTLFAAPQGREAKDGLIYTQFYVKIKTPFDSAKVYVFDNDSVENLALDPGYLRSLWQEGGAVTFSKGVCQFAYLHSKQRAYANLMDNRWRSYGTREEHRISLAMMEEIYAQWRQWDLYEAEDEEGASPLPYYIIPTRELLDFLYAQINKYCFLFEHILAHTARTYSLPETAVMVAALRALRFCYCSSLLDRELLLARDRWETRGGQDVIVKEGLGMREGIERCGIGWFLPKFNWAVWRLAAPHGENILVGNLLMHEEYKRRWRAVKDLRDVFVRFNQADSWYERYNLQENRALLEAWLEYLHALNLEQFDMDVWKAMQKANRRSPELKPGIAPLGSEVRYCYADMKKAFVVDGTACPPHLVTGNKMRFERVMDLLNFLFLWDEEERPGWGNKPYRVVLKQTFDLLERRLGYRPAEAWLDEFLHLVRLTHWILPYPSNKAFITCTKTSQRQGLTRRMMWFSAVYADPEAVQLPMEEPPLTLFSMLSKARRRAFGDSRDLQAWSTSLLLAGYRAAGVEVSGQEASWVAGKRSIGLKGFAPLWERGRPPQLRMQEEIRGLSLEELDAVMAGLSVERTANGERSVRDHGIGEASQVSREDVAYGRIAEPRRTAAVAAGRGIMAAFAKRPAASVGAEGDVAVDTVSTPGIGVSSDSSNFIPSDSGRSG